MFERKIIIGKPVFSNGRYTIPFEVPSELASCFKVDSFWFESPDAGVVPDSIAVVPAVANLLPFSWVFDCMLEVGELDKVFYDAIPKIKKGYIDMLQNLTLRGGLEVASVDVEHSNDLEKSYNAPLLLFSGGVDAWCTLVRHVQERPRIVSIWGADIRSYNDSGWDIVQGHSMSVARSFDLSYSFVKSNFREMLDYQILSDCLKDFGTEYGWWHDLQHGIGLLSLTVPLAYATNAPRTYIASSFFEGDKGKYVCASDPTIDNVFAAGPTRGFHDGYELTRQNKIEAIVDFAESSNNEVNLRVCFHVQSGHNCCSCEKCGRTILGIYAAGGNPADFGFRYSFVKLALLSFKMRFFYIMRLENYVPIQNASRLPSSKIPRVFHWIIRRDLCQICTNDFKRKWRRFHACLADCYHGLVSR